MQENKTVHGCICRNCSAKLVTQRKSADTYCRFCGEPALTAHDYENTIKPEYVIEFETDKAKARRLFKQYLAARPLINRGFRQKADQGNFAAVYIPVCITDIEFETNVVTQQGSVSMNTCASGIVTNLSNCADELLFSLISPYDFEKLIPYNDENEKIPFEFSDKESAKEKIKTKIEEIQLKAASECKNNIQNDGHIRTDSCTHTVISHSDRYALLPVWVLTCNTKTFCGRIFMNGQNGRIIGTPPPSFARVACVFGAVAAACTIIGEIIYMAVNGL